MVRYLVESTRFFAVVRLLYYVLHAFGFGLHGGELNPSKGTIILRGPWIVRLRKVPKLADSRLARRSDNGEIMGLRERWPNVTLFKA